jgi:hypothetical protein
VETALIHPLRRAPRIAVRSSEASWRSLAMSLTATCEACTVTPIDRSLAKARDSDSGLIPSRAALTKQVLVRGEHHRGRRRDDVLHRFRLEAAEHGDARDHLQIAGRELGGHGSLIRSNRNSEEPIDEIEG